MSHPSTAVRTEHLVRLRQSSLVSCCVAIAGVAMLAAGLGGCAASPRSEYLSVRGQTVHPTSSGDGSRLADRDRILAESRRGGVLESFVAVSPPETLPPHE